MTAETISFPLDPGAAALLTRLHAAGYAAYAVGGCVRDSLLGQTPHDWDLCTSATPEQVLELFGEAHCIPTGLQHGTVTVKHGGELYEITTFRTEGAYSDGRHPLSCFRHAMIVMLYRACHEQNVASSAFGGILLR